MLEVMCMNSERLLPTFGVSLCVFSFHSQCLKVPSFLDRLWFSMLSHR